MANQGASKLRIVPISSARANGVISQRDLARAGEKEIEAEHARIAAERLESEHYAILSKIQEALENGAAIEPGPLTATIKTRKALVLHRSKTA